MADTKFSQFANGGASQGGDQVVGLRAGVNTRFSSPFGQFLTISGNLSDVASSTISFNNISPLTTKGDFLSYDGTNNIRVGIGANQFIPLADSTQTSGWRWANINDSFINPVIIPVILRLSTFTPRSVLFIDSSLNVAQDNSRFFFNQATTTFGASNNPVSISGATNAVVGGIGHTLGGNSTFIGGGSSNTVDGQESSIIGGSNNVLHGTEGFIAGGVGNNISVNSSSCNIIGSSNGTISGTSSLSSIVGSLSATLSNALRTIVMGGESNVVAPGTDSAIIAGSTNTLDGDNSAILAGQNSEVIGDNSIVLGGNNNDITGSNSCAGGTRAKVTQPGSFAWSDQQNADFNVTQSNVVAFRASNGFGINTPTIGLSSAVEISYTNKALRLTNVAGVVSISTPEAGHIMFDTTTAQFVGYNGTSWVILG